MSKKLSLIIFTTIAFSVIISFLFFSKNIDNKKNKNIAFIVYTKTLGGKGVLPLYKELKNNGHNVKIVFIPMIYFGELEAEVDIEFSRLFDSNDVVFPCGKVSPYKQCSGLEKYKVDEIFTQNPYSYFTGSVLEKYYSIDKLKQIAKINYIPYGPHIFHQNVLNNNKLPSLVDNVFVDSESTKDIFVNRFSFPTNRVIVSGYQPYKTIKDKTDKIVEKNKKLTILYLPRWALTFRNRLDHEGGSTFLNYHYFFYNYIKNNKDINFILRPHTLLYSMSVRTKFLSQSDLDFIMSRFDKLDNVILSQHKNASLIEDIIKSDIVISDGSSAIAEALVANKPVIYLSNGANIEFESCKLSKATKKHVLLAYDPDDILRYIEILKNHNYNSNVILEHTEKEITEYKSMLDPVDNPAKFIADYISNN